MAWWETSSQPIISCLFESIGYRYFDNLLDTVSKASLLFGHLNGAPQPRSEGAKRWQSARKRL